MGNTIKTVKELKEFLNTLNDNDIVTIETINLTTGDVEDLYPFHMDVIEGIELQDGSIVNEVRFCQENNSTNLK